MLPMQDFSKYLKGARILLIDDSEPFQHLTSEMLKKSGVASVDIASTLSEGIQLMNYNVQSIPPEYDLVLMDINLPDGNGMQGCQFITSHAATYNIPVIVISGASKPAVVQQALTAGASDFMQKPLLSDLLKVRLGMLMKFRAIDSLGAMQIQFLLYCSVY